MSGSVPEIETARLRLRMFAPDDLDELTVIRSDSEVMRYIGTGVTQTKDQAQAWLERHTARWEQHNLGMWAVTFAKEKEVLGWCGLAMLDDTIEVEVGYGLAKTFWGMNIASEAARASLQFGFEEHALNRIVAVAIPENIASRRVMEKLGMKYERQAYYYGADVAYYAITRDEFHPDDSTYILHKNAS